MTRSLDVPIKILYVHGVGQIGGAERELLTWLKYLDRIRFLPYVVCPKDGPLTTALKNLHILNKSIFFPSWRKLFHVVAYPFSVLRLVHLVRQWNIDIIHVNDYWWAPLGIMVARITGRPCLVHVRQEIEPRKISQYWLNKRCLIVPVSQSIGRVIQNSGVKQEYIQVLLSSSAITDPKNSSLYPEDLEILNRVKGQPVIGTVANLFPRKGLEYLVAAFQLLIEEFPDIFLVLVGEGDENYERKLREQVKQLNLTEHVLFAGFQNRPEIFMTRFDVFVLPSVLEGLGIVLLEAMALGKPIVATKVGGIPEIVQHQKTGLLVNSGDVEDLYRALHTLCQNPARGRQMGEEGKKRVAEHFSLSGMIDSLSGLYERVLAKG